MWQYLEHKELSLSGAEKSTWSSAY